MYIRPSTAAFVILFNFAVVNAGIVPAARVVNGLEQRSEFVGNYAEPATYAEPVAREESPEPDPGRRIGVGLEQRSEFVGNYAEPATYAEPVARVESPEPDPGRRISTGTTLQV
ncbi:hypothetical protein CY34DRAFT_12105 [Suillus luteus UH-Slu-Lm8-n1]|uniref:Uncharacterized protein n=1 Tax=Suillus luteus UH-Slu-Lm8-n1 TaxID=930992 RepID=A0A0D0AYN8_9AGAM|nr:hypothetical protein CY34DRAFT_12105 [Suillus luteus UH-Slu-Lm8-n1]